LEKKLARKLKHSHTPDSWSQTRTSMQETFRKLAMAVDAGTGVTDPLMGDIQHLDILKQI
jgi:hypothetical protein